MSASMKQSMVENMTPSEAANTLKRQ